jgi:hypothetical protein
LRDHISATDELGRAGALVASTLSVALGVTALICAKPPPCAEPYTRRVDLGQFAAAVRRSSRSRPWRSRGPRCRTVATASPRVSQAEWC